MRLLRLKHMNTGDVMTPYLPDLLDGAADIASSEDSPVIVPTGAGKDESEPVWDPMWEKCMNSLIDEWKHPDNARAEVPPSRDAIEAALTWLHGIRVHRPTDPPSLITAEPAGGISFEHRSRIASGQEEIAEFTFYNEGRARFALLMDTKIVELRDIPFRFPSRRGG